MSPDSQAKVLRALQENEIVRVGGNESIPVDVRVISATNKDLQAEIEEGNFREDLFHRLNVIPVHLPPLRERREDIALLTNSFLEKLSEKEIFYSGKFFSEEAIEALKNQAWPGNIRALQNAIERLLLLSPEDEITAGDVEQFVTRKRSSRKQLERLVDEIESFHVFKERSEEHTSELQSRGHLVCRLLLEKKKPSRGDKT